MDHTPILALSSPFFRNVHHGQKQHFQEAIICGQRSLRLSNLSELAIDPFNGIRGVNQPANLLRKFEVGAQI